MKITMQNRELSLTQLPPDILRYIISFLRASDYRLSTTCKMLFEIFNSNWYMNFWKAAYQSYPEKLINTDTGEEEIAMQQEPIVFVNRTNWAQMFYQKDKQVYHSSSTASRHLCELIRKGDIESAMMLDINYPDITQYTKGKDSPLMMAYEQRSLLLLKRFYQIGYKYLKRVNPHSFPICSDQHYRFTALHLAVLCFQPVKEIHRLIELGCNLNRKSKTHDTALHIATTTEQIETIAALLSHNADVSIFNRFKKTPLHIAIIHKNIKSFEMLLNANAIVNTCSYDYIRPPLLLAIEYFPEMAKILLQRGARPNCSHEYDRNTLLSFNITDPELIALRQNFLDVQNHGRNYSITVSALFLAKLLGHEDLVASLQQAMHSSRLKVLATRI